jgi:hypothetical protein
MAQQPDIGPWPPLSSPSIRGSIPGFETVIFFMVRGSQPLAQPPTWRTRVSLLVWIIPFNLSGMDGPTSSYATAGIALRVTIRGINKISLVYCPFNVLVLCFVNLYCLYVIGNHSFEEHYTIILQK